MTKFLEVLAARPKPVEAAPAAPAGDKLDQAMDAAGIPGAAAPAPAAAAADPRQALAGLGDKPNGEALISFVESWVPLIVRGYAVAQGRVWDRECDAACRLSITERQNLKLTADAAAPYVARLIEHSEKLAALGFVVQFGFILAGKFSLVKSKPLAAPKARPAEEGAVEDGAADEAEKPEPKTVPVHRRPVGRPKK
jgi:hypothetical protein